MLSLFDNLNSIDYNESLTLFFVTKKEKKICMTNTLMKVQVALGTNAEQSRFIYNPFDTFIFF